VATHTKGFAGRQAVYDIPRFRSAGVNTKTKGANNNVCFERTIAVVSLALMLLIPNFAKANDGVLDVDNEFHAYPIGSAISR
jgi:hypothetical protein